MKKAILFVDDEIQVLQGLKRSLRAPMSGYDLYYANSGQDALDLLANTSIDLIVSDMRMPGMDGHKLLDAVSKQYPNVIRYVLSGHTDMELALKSTRVAHQFIAKPVETQKLADAIQHSFQLREMQTDPKLIEIITGIQKLPSLPSLYMELVNVMEAPDASARAISEIISKDITMTAKILQIVNSAFYGLPNKMTNLQQAVAYLGITTIKCLVLSQHVFSQYQSRSTGTLSIDTLWNHSLRVGSLARNITKNENAIRLLDDSQVAGLMHDIGKLIQLEIPEFYDKYDEKVKSGMDSLEAEYEILNTSHAELGAYLLGIWGLPDPVVQAVAYHHHPSRQGETNYSALTAVHVANGFLAAVPAVEGEPPPEPTFDMTYLEAINFANRLPSWSQLYQAMVDKER